MSSNLAYIVYHAMTSSINNISLYILDSNNNKHFVNVAIAEPGTLVYVDNSDSSYTTASFNLSINGNTIVTIPLNSVTKTPGDILVVILNIQVSVNLPGQLGEMIAQAVQGIFAGLNMNLGCSAVTEYIIYNVSTGSSSSGSVRMNFSLVNNNQFNASASISYSQGYAVEVTNIVIRCSFGNINQSIFSGSLQSSECTSSSGCTFTVTVTFTS